jgi:molybdate transport system ATP-binding protein
MIHARIRKHFPAGPGSAAFSLEVEFKASAGVGVLFGPSGAGKTLTLDAIAGFVKPDEGRVMLDDEILFDGASGVHVPPRARHCGYVFQDYALFPHMTLRKNLEFAAERRPRLERHRKVNEVLEQFHIADVAGRRPHEVSGGQKQRCSIARALIGSPRLLLLDEPTQGLEAPLRTEFYDVLRQVRAEFRIPILLVTHHLEECFELGDEMFVIREGRLVQSGTPRSVYDQPANANVARLLGLSNLFEVEIIALDPGRNLSRLRFRDVELSGPYFPGKFKGDRVWMCVSPAELIASPRDGKPGPNQVPVQLVRAAERPQTVRLEFAGDVTVEMSRPDYERQKHNKDWVVEFPPRALRVL